MLIVDADHRLLFETWNTRCLPAGSAACTWRAGSGAVFPLDSNARRPEGWTSADAAGLAILPGLVRYDEATGAGPIRHAFRVTVRDSNGYVFPASHVAGSNASAPPMGARLRLKASKDISGFPAQAQKIFQAMKTYGLIVADNGSDLYVQGTYDTRWDNGVLNPAFSAIKASDFEVLELGWKPSAPPVATTSPRPHAVPPRRHAAARAARVRADRGGHPEGVRAHGRLRRPGDGRRPLGERRRSSRLREPENSSCFRLASARRTPRPSASRPGARARTTPRSCFRPTARGVRR